MAFKQSPGRLSFSKTGYGLPSALKQVGDTDPTLKARAEAEAKAKQQAAGPNTGGSKDIRTFSGTASAVIPGQKVTKFAKTKEEIAKWKAAPKENKDKFKPKTISESASVSDTGMDKPVTPAKPKPNLGEWYRETVASNFVSGSASEGWGREYSQNRIKNSEAKNKYDKEQAKIPGYLGGVKHAEKNTFEHRPITPREDRAIRSGHILNGNDLNPFIEDWKDKKGEAPGSGQMRRDKWIDTLNDRFTQDSLKVDSRKKMILSKVEDRIKAKATNDSVKLAGRAEIKTIKDKEMQERIKNKSKASSPMKQKVSKKTAYDIKEASNQKLKPSARKHYAENAQAAMKNKKKK